MAGQDVDVQVVGADMAENQVFEAGGGEVGFVEGENIAQAGVGHGHVRAELDQAGVDLAPIVNRGIHQLGHGVAQQLEFFDFAGMVGENGGVGVRVALAQAFGGGQHGGFGGVFVVGMPFGVEAGGAGGHGGHGDVPGCQHVRVRPEEIQGPGVEVFDGRQTRPGNRVFRSWPRTSGLWPLFGPQGVDKTNNPGGVRQKSHEAPDGCGGGEEAHRGFGDDAERAFRADEQVQQVHVGFDVVSGGVFDGRAGQDRQFAGEGTEPETVSGSPVAAAAQVEEFTPDRGHAQPGDMVARRTVKKRQGAGRIAGNHAADAGGGFGGVGGEEMTGRDGGADGGEGGAGLDNQRVAVRPDGLHLRQIQDQPAVRNGPAGDAGARALHRHRHPGRAGFGQNSPNIFLRAGEGQEVRGPGAPGLVTQVFRPVGLERFDHGGQYNLPRPCAHG